MGLALIKAPVPNMGFQMSLGVAKAAQVAQYLKAVSSNLAQTSTWT